MSDQSTPPDYFDRLYADNPDPWRFATDHYEHDKYAATLAMLPRARFRSGVEIGCSVGVLTRLLAGRCDTLLGIDGSETALVHARTRCRDAGHVAFARMQVPAEWPPHRFDLIMLSEILYFLSRSDLQAVARQVLRSLDADGVVVLVDWLGETGSAQSGEEAAENFIAATRGDLCVLAGQRTPQYRIDLLTRPA